MIGKWILRPIIQNARRMSQLGPFELTHPELMSETELRAILKNRCIDFSKYEKLCRSELIELYRRVAMPLPQRGNEIDGKSKPHKLQKESTDCSQDKSSSLNRPRSLKRNFGEVAKASEATDFKKSKFLDNDVKAPPGKICPNSANSAPECNGTEKRTSDRRDEEASGKKRQKITWP